MEVVYFLVPVGLLILILAIWAFCWAVKSGQFEDMDGPAHQILFDDKEQQKSVTAQPVDGTSHDGQSPPFETHKTLLRANGIYPSYFKMRRDNK